MSLIYREYVGGGYVTVMVRGETGAVNAAVRAGADACERVGDGLAAHIVAHPHEEVQPALVSSGAAPQLVGLAAQPLAMSSEFRGLPLDSPANFWSPIPIFFVVLNPSCNYLFKPPG